MNTKAVSTAESVVRNGSVLFTRGAEIPAHADTVNVPQATSYLDTSSIISALSLGPEDVVCDIGCGTGSFVSSIAEIGSHSGYMPEHMVKPPVKKVIGIERDPSWARQAYQQLLDDPDVQCDVEIYCGDATLFPNYHEATVFYFYYPFGPRTLAEVLDRIEDSLETHPRKVRMVFKYTETTPWVVPFLQNRGYRCQNVPGAQFTVMWDAQARKSHPGRGQYIAAIKTVADRYT